MFTYHRPGFSLNGTWKFCPDPMQRCRRQQWWKSHASPNQIFPCWDMEGLWDIQVPGSWKKQFAALEWYDGHAVYVREFDRPEIPEGHEVFLAFDGILYAADIYLNGQKVARHECGYSPFTVRVTDVIAAKNQLFVLVDNSQSSQRAPGEIFDWNNEGGIINDVKLVVVPSVYIENFRTRTRLDGENAVLEFEISLASRDLAAVEEVCIEIPELAAKVKVTAKAGESVSARIVLPRREIELWSPKHPKLYETRLSTRQETVTDEIGYREIRTKGRQILLNGKPLRLYGVCVHSEFSDSGRTATPENISRIVSTAKDLGLNFLRCAHYPYSEAFGRAMDRAGLLWWQEVPAYWIFSVREEPMTRLLCSMLEDTIRRDWNRASLIFWSISNECCWRNPENPAEHNYSYWIEAAKLVRQLDPSRLLTCAEASNFVSTASTWSPSSGDQFVGVNQALEETHRPMHGDEFYKLLDVLAGNLYVDNPGEEEVAYRRYVRLLRRYNKPLMLSEFGSISLRGAEVPPDQLGSEERHAKMIEMAYDSFLGLPEIVGCSPWILIDGRSPIHWRWYNQGKGLYRHGFLDENWKPKKAYYALKKSVAKLKQCFELSEVIPDGFEPVRRANRPTVSCGKNGSR